MNGTDEETSSKESTSSQDQEEQEDEVEKYLKDHSDDQSDKDYSEDGWMTPHYEIDLDFQFRIIEKVPITEQEFNTYKHFDIRFFPIPKPGQHTLEVGRVRKFLKKVTFDILMTNMDASKLTSESEQYLQPKARLDVFAYNLRAKAFWLLIRLMKIPPPTPVLCERVIVAY